MRKRKSDITTGGGKKWGTCPCCGGGGGVVAKQAGLRGEGKAGVFQSEKKGQTTHVLVATRPLWENRLKRDKGGTIGQVAIRSANRPKKGGGLPSSHVSSLGPVWEGRGAWAQHKTITNGGKRGRSTHVSNDFSRNWEARKKKGLGFVLSPQSRAKGKTGLGGGFLTSTVEARRVREGNGMSPTISLFMFNTEGKGGTAVARF